MAEEVGIYIGKRVRALRKQHGLTQAEVAVGAGMPQGSMSRLERGDYDDIGGKALLGLARALRVKPQTLLPERTPRPRTGGGLPA